MNEAIDMFLYGFNLKLNKETFRYENGYLSLSYAIVQYAYSKGELVDLHREVLDYLYPTQKFRNIDEL